MWRLGHRPALDGLRGLAILLVLAAHFSNPFSRRLDGSGAVGVTLFFTLSGFLITALLLGEKDARGDVSLRGFYRRRVFRLMPALFAMVLTVLLIQTYWQQLFVSGGMTVSAMFSVSNLWAMNHENGFHNALGHTWSLGIEEQFYLLWPATVLLGLRWGHRGVAVLGSVALAVSVAVVLLPGGDAIHGSLERGASLLIGCLLAVWATGQRDRASKPLVAGAALVALVPFCLMIDTFPTAAYALVVPLIAAVALWAVGFGEGPRWLCGPVLRWFGRRSYGIYLWHYPVIYTLSLHDMPGYWPTHQFTRLVVSLAVAELSWRLIEQPAQRFGRRLDARKRVVVGDLGAGQDRPVQRHLVDHAREELV